MGWSEELKQTTREELGLWGGSVKCIDDRYGNCFGVAEVTHEGVIIYEHKDAFEHNDVEICRFSDINEMIEGGWVID